MLQGTLTRRAIITAIPAAGLAGLLPSSASASGMAQAPPLSDLYRAEDETAVLAAARAIIAEDYVATLIILDAAGVPRARSVGVNDPDESFGIWIGTRRTSRKVTQIRANPNATLHFARDNLAQNMAGAYYASLMGTATVHTDAATLAAQAPAEEYRRSFWPNFPDDFAAIRFQTKWLEVTGRGIRGDTANWQPQAVVLSR